MNSCGLFLKRVYPQSYPQPVDNFLFSFFHIFMLSDTNKNSVVGAPRRKKVCYREYIHSPLGDGDMFSAYKGELID